MSLLGNPQLHSMLEHLSDTVGVRTLVVTTLSVAVLTFAFATTGVVPYIDLLLGLAALQAAVITVLVVWWEYYGKMKYGMQAMFDNIKAQEGRQ